MDRELLIAGGVALLAILFFFWLLIKYTGLKKNLRDNEKMLVQHEAKRDTLENTIGTLEKEITLHKSELKIAGDMRIKAERINAGMTERLQGLREKEERLSVLESENRDFEKQLVSMKSRLEATRDKLAHWESAETIMNTSFENLANRIFDKKNEQFSTQSKESLQHMLVPFRQQMSDFRQQIETVYTEENKERRSLQHEVRHLKELNQHMAQEAVNLTRALKGDKKMQGNWGEMVLERVLSESGLREGHEYRKQVALKTVDGDRQQPDVIVHLPDNKDVIIDSKVSLVDYDRYHKAENDTDRNLALAAHIKAIRNHIRLLGKKDYSALKGIRTLDYVLMFIPVEPAFYAAIEAQPGLFQEALDNNIMLVAPTNLLVALKTIHHVWRYERQSVNTRKIAEKAGSIHDKLQGMIEDMSDLGQKIDKLSHCYGKAMNKFKTGRGNLLKQADDFVRLGVKVKKEFDADLMDEALTESGTTTESL